MEHDNRFVLYIVLGVVTFLCTLVVSVTIMSFTMHGQDARKVRACITAGHEWISGNCLSRGK